MVLCIICFKSIKNSVNLECNHNYHFKCLKNKNLKCVLCNASIIKESKETKITRKINSKLDLIEYRKDGLDKYKLNILLEIFQILNENIGWVQTKLKLKKVVLEKIEEFINHPQLKIMKINFIEKFKYELNKTKDYLK